ncbi:MAG: HAMP domain-containing histidine kinase [Solirubrobacterales bacterium]|nr:HAMP domain-containing histidine kinase [Solirubrobacterales bacterium]
MIAVALAGWLAAGGAGLAAGAAWRALTGRMETVARACHELRGPLTAARLGLQLGAGTGDLSPARLRAIDLELGRAALALEDLDVARTRRLPSWHPPERVDFATLLADSVEAWRPAGTAAGVELHATWSGPAVGVWGERLRLAQATGNLIANAIEHGEGSVEIRGSARAGWVRVEVSDTGPGLPAPVAELARRAQAGRARRGRGLAIATAIVASHGGRLAAAPSPHGARLVLELPAMAADEATEAGGTRGEDA